jgi:hypothetical protein
MHVRGLTGWPFYRMQSDGPNQSRYFASLKLDNLENGPFLDPSEDVELLASC